MAPSRNRRRKVGLMRIDAALASMRPVGFSDAIVRKSVKDLLKASYKLLIETILEAQQLAEEGEVGGKGRDDVGGSCEKSQSVPQLCNEQGCREEQCVEMVCKTKIADEKCKGKKIQVESDLISKDGTEQAVPGSQLDFVPTCSSMIMDRVPTNQIRKPCYGWISDDEADDFLLLPPANATNPN